MKKYLPLILCIFLLHSCNQPYTSNPEILRAEKLLNSHPDSSFVILSGIQQPEKLSNADYAAWRLNYTHARYKLHKLSLSDSLIDISIQYYTKANDKIHAGTAWYLNGCIYRLNKKNKEAILAFKNADRMLKSTNEYRIRGLVQFNMGYICMSDEVYNHSLTYFQQSITNFKLAGDRKTAAYAYREISDMYNQLNYPFDSVMAYSNKALELSKSAGDSLNYYSILTRQGELMYKKNIVVSKNNILRGYRYLQSNLPYYASYLGYIYSQLGKPDSARYYSTISLADTSLKVINYQAAAFIAKDHADFKKAYSFLEKAYVQRDSMSEINVRSQLYRIDRQYNLTEEEEKSAELNIANQAKLIWIILLSFIVLLAVFVIFQIINWNKKNKLIQDNKMQKLEYEKNEEKTKNDQKREIIHLNLNHKIENTLRLNRLKRGVLQQDTKDAFIQEITYQSILSENVWKEYIDNANKLFDNGIAVLKEKHPDLSKLDQMVIALICLKVKIQDSCNLLDMEKVTMYKRRKTIKKRLELNAETDLNQWLKDNLKQ